MPLPFPAYTGAVFTPTIHRDITPATNPLTTPALAQPGKTILVTGAGRGIGRAIALRYAEARVATVILLARTSTELEAVEKDVRETNGDIKVLRFVVDVTDAAQVKACAKEVGKQEGRLDVLINNAGAIEHWVPIAETDPSGWWRAFEVNVKGTYLLLHAFLPLLLKTVTKLEDEGKLGKVDVLNVVSIGGTFVSPTSSGYSCSKLAALRLTEYVDAEYGDKGIQAVGLHPGGVKTELVMAGPQWLQQLCTDTSDLCGGFVVWLTSGEKAWLRGRYLSANWDVDELEGMKEDIVQADKLKVRMVV